MKLEIFGDKENGFFGHGEWEPGDPVLKPCPFCGSATIEVWNTHSPHYKAECETCDAQGPTGSAVGTSRPKRRCIAEKKHRFAFHAAINNWNTRA